MDTQESFRERQENELEVLQSIYGKSVVDLRNLAKGTKGWKPLNLLIALEPQKGSIGGADVYARTKLHVICPAKYPNVVPQIVLEESKGLSDKEINELTQILVAYANANKNEVMIYELAVEVQKYLHDHNKQPMGSFYDQMVQQRIERSNEKRQLQQLKLNKEQQLLRDEVLKRKEQFRSEAKLCRDMRTASQSEASPTHRTNSSSENSEITTAMQRCHIYPNECEEHKNSDMLHFPNVGRKILKGCCLGHSQKGCVTFSGIDIDTGQLLYITEWVIKFGQFEGKCTPPYCFLTPSSTANASGTGGITNGDHQKCTGHTWEQIVQSIERSVSNLAQLSHKNLVTYECVMSVKKKDAIVLYLVQDFVLGASVCSITNTLGWCYEGASMVARGVIEALIFLHNQGVSHNILYDCTVFMDNCGNVRVTDFTVIPYLLELIGCQRPSINDLPALAILIESMSLTPNAEMSDFIEQCRSTRTLSASILLDHPFLRVATGAVGGIGVNGRGGEYGGGGGGGEIGAGGNGIGGGYNKGTIVPIHRQLARRHDGYADGRGGGGNNMTVVPSSLKSSSRLTTEFQFLQLLGSGAYGDVHKMRNILDNREYAIKRIPLLAHSRRQLYKKMTREVELLSRLNHENVVRYFNSWIENTDDDITNEIMSTVESGDLTESEIENSLNNVKLIAQNIDADKAGDWLARCDDSDDSSDGIVFRNSDDEDSELNEFSEKYKKGGSNDDDEDGDDDDDDEEVLGDEDDDDYDESKPSVTDKTKDITKRSTQFRSPKLENQIMYIQMEFCENCTLRTAIDGGLYKDIDRLWRLFREIIEGLAHIHQLGMIHRDLKPVNIFLDSRDQVKIGDFGLATTSFMAQQNQEAHLKRIAGTDGGGGGGTTSTAVAIAALSSFMGDDKDSHLDVGSTLTGKVGTALYVAPELMGVAYQSTYNQKVDLYSLGIILFEMSSKVFDTAMERHQVMMALRSPKIVIPDEMLSDSKYSKNVAIIKWLLDHDPKNRPTAEELLSSNLIPPLELEAREIHEMLRNALANPQSKVYKHLVARCLEQSSDTVSELTYHYGLNSQASPILEVVKNKIISIFRKHGGTEWNMPLLYPWRKENANSTDVRLMTHSGTVVMLPHEMRIPFVKHVVRNQIDRTKRYSVGVVYREMKMFNYHPKQFYECAFDIITPTKGNLLADAELISIANEITTDIAAINSKSISFRLNHIQLLNAVLLYCDVPCDRYRDLFAASLDVMAEKISKFQYYNAITNIMQTRRVSASTLMEMLMTELPIGGTRATVMDVSTIKTLLKSRGNVASMTKTALKDLETIAKCAQRMGVTCSITAFIGLCFGYERCSEGGIVWQMLYDVKSDQKLKKTILAAGCRYDTMLAEYQGHPKYDGTSAKMTGVGFSFAMDKIVSIIRRSIGKEYRVFDVIICASSPKVTIEVCQMLHSFWSLGIRAGAIDDTDSLEGQEIARATCHHIVLFGEGGKLCVRSTTVADDFCDKFFDNQYELIEHVQRTIFMGQQDQRSGGGGGGGSGGGGGICGIGGIGGLGSISGGSSGIGGIGAANDSLNVSQLGNISGINSSIGSMSVGIGGGGNSNNNSILNMSSGSGGGGGGGGSGGGGGGSGSSYNRNTSLLSTAVILPGYEVYVLSQEKLSVNIRKRCQNQAIVNMTPSLLALGKKEFIQIIAIDLPSVVVKAISSAIDPKDVTFKESRDEIQKVIERFPRSKRYIQDIFDEAIDIISTKKNTNTILGFYSLTDNSYRIVL